MSKKKEDPTGDEGLPPVPDLASGGGTNEPEPKTETKPPETEAPAPKPKAKRGRPPGSVRKVAPAPTGGALDLKLSVNYRSPSGLSIVFDREASLPIESDLLANIAQRLETWVNKLGEQLG